MQTFCRLLIVWQSVDNSCRHGLAVFHYCNLKALLPIYIYIEAEVVFLAGFKSHAIPSCIVQSVGNNGK